MRKLIMMEKRKLNKKIIFRTVFAVILCTVCLTLLGLQLGMCFADKIQCWHPDYEKVDLSGILQKQTLSDDDYDTIYRQTGLTRTGADRMLARGIEGKKRLLKIQDDYFGEYVIKNSVCAPFVCSDCIDKNITCVYLADGDIIITASTHISGWRIGHAGLVTDGKKGEVIQANQYGEKSRFGSVREFTDRVNFMVVSPKVDDGTKAEVVNYARKNLKGKSYNAAAGILTSKNKINSTQCAHLTWYAYRQFGIDLDGNGGKMVVPRDIANSPEVELVQTFGFNPYKLWT